MTSKHTKETALLLSLPELVAAAETNPKNKILQAELARRYANIDYHNQPTADPRPSRIR